MIESVPMKRGMPLIVAAGFIMVVTMVLGIISLVSIFNLSRVLDGIDSVAVKAKEQAELSSCRSRISQDIQETFRQQLGAIFVASEQKDNATVRTIVKAINETPTFADRVAKECSTTTG